MKNKSNNNTTFFCFSPLVMIVTFFAEIVMAIYVVWRYGLDRITRLVALILVCLAIFQLAEYMICTGALGLTGAQWARVGHVAITLLPPLGLHLGYRMMGRQNNLVLGAAYGSAALLSSLFLFSPQAVQAGVCLGNYVIFERGDGMPFWPWSFAIYYYGWLFFGLKMFMDFANQTKQKHLGKALRGLALGYAVFIVPTTVVNVINPTTIHGIPSIMCGFAVLFAFILTLWVVPQYRRSVKSLKKSQKNAIIST